MRITKRQLKRIIREERQRILRELHDPLDPHAGGRPLSKGAQEVFAEAGLTPEEAALTRAELEGETSMEADEWHNSGAYEKLLWYYIDSGEMPYGVAKARTGMPDLWILDQLESLA
jgi:hypothetical protein